MLASPSPILLWLLLKALGIVPDKGTPQETMQASALSLDPNIGSPICTSSENACNLHWGSFYLLP